jgi:DNA invertase Pin-like site-specific DNA recombinase
VRLIGYARVSTDEQATSGLGLEAQEATLRRAAEFRGYDLVEIIRDEGISGSTVNRPGLQHALERVAVRDVDGLVVAKLDRLTRSMRDFCEVVDWFEEARAPLVMIEPEVDTSTPAGRAVAHVMVAFAEMERGMIGDRTRVAMAAKRERGECIGLPSVLDNPALVARVHELADEGLGRTAIARTLTDEGWPTARGAKAWRASALQIVLGYERPPVRRRRAELPEIPRGRRRAA